MTVEKPKTHCILLNLPDFCAAHADMDAAEFGLFVRACGMQLARGQLSQAQMERLPAIVREQFNDDGKCQIIDDEITRAKASSEKARSKANRRWGNEPAVPEETSAGQQQCPSNAPAMPQHCAGNATGTGTGTGTKEEAEASSNTPLPPAGGEPPAKPARSVGYSAEFEAFWELYPRKTGKGEAWSAWKARVQPLPEPEALAVVLAAATASEQWQKECGKYIPHPTTWLKGRRWEDQVQPPPTAGMTNSKLADMLGF